MTKPTGRPGGKPRADLPDDDAATVRVNFLAKAGGIRWVDAKAGEDGVTRTDVIRAALKEYATRHPLKDRPAIPMNRQAPTATP